MEFTTKDLMVTVLPRPELNKDLIKICLFRTIICRFPTFACGVRCSFFPTVVPCYCTKYITCGFISPGGVGPCGFGNSCGPGNSACDPTQYCIGGSREPFVIEHLEDLITLKADLQATLKSLDAIQKEGLPSALGSKAEAEDLERGLTEALEQVQAAKKALKQ